MFLILVFGFAFCDICFLQPCCHLLENDGSLGVALLYIIISCAFVTFLCCFLGQVRYLIVSIPDLCLLSYFNSINVPLYVVPCE